MISDDKLVVLAERTGLTVDQVKSGIKLVQSGNTEILDRVIAGEVSVAEALAAIRRLRK
jgi:hypothetical protein